MLAKLDLNIGCSPTVYHRVEVKIECRQICSPKVSRHRKSPSLYITLTEALIYNVGTTLFPCEVGVVTSEMLRSDLETSSHRGALLTIPY